MVAFYFKSKPQRASLKDRWPASPEENLERLADAGFPYDRQIPKCDNCRGKACCSLPRIFLMFISLNTEMGHITKHCKSERIVIDRVEIRCVNCGGTGHRARDCPEPRVDKFSCRNCGAPDHKAVDCTEPHKMDDVECRRCNETGHMAKDCPKGGFSKACRNCGAEGHKAYECDQPKNMDTVQCRNCDESKSPRKSLEYQPLSPTSINV
ncbi:hypothetical protein VTN31DRAFT_5163 [Thermomyces dupontii]|uniref:uncharacterized protein n=1 Tax=Talaromyces thermophilus TaxID=28565 RepID=UPI0037435208